MNERSRNLDTPRPSTPWHGRARISCDPAGGGEIAVTFSEDVPHCDFDRVLEGLFVTLDAKVIGHLISVLVLPDVLGRSPVWRPTFELLVGPSVTRAVNECLAGKELVADRWVDVEPGEAAALITCWKTFHIAARVRLRAPGEPIDSLRTAVEPNWDQIGGTVLLATPASAEQRLGRHSARCLRLPPALAAHWGMEDTVTVSHIGRTLEVVVPRAGALEAPNLRVELVEPLATGPVHLALGTHELHGAIPVKEDMDADDLDDVVLLLSKPI